MTSPSTSDYYEQYWSEGGFVPHGRSWPALQDLYRRNISPASHVLDLGCGDGMTSGPTLTQMGHRYQGADVSAAAVDRARGAGLAAEKIADAGGLPFEDGTFDAVTCIEVLEHLFRPDAAAAEVLRVLRPGGVFLATTPNIAYWRSRLNLLCVGRFDPIGDHESVTAPWRDPHIRFFTPASMRSMLLTTGFASVDIEGQEGGLLNGLPYIQRRRGKTDRSRLYAALEQRRPGLLAYRLAAVAVKG